MTAARTTSLATLLKAQAYGLGFDLAGIARLGPADTAAAFDEWLARGYAGTMTYLGRHADLRRDSRRPQPGMRSALVVGLNYGGTQPAGSVARYARGADYHRVMWRLLDALGAWLRAQAGGATRAFVDTGPVLERDLARRAGLGWMGKNTMLIHPRIGSHFFIGSLFTDLDLAPDPPFPDEHCGTCRRCLDACPTGALIAPLVMDARRCISYLTIENREAMPLELRERVGSLVYGCDICQDVCPWNVRFSRDVSLAALAPDRTPPNPDLAELLRLDDASYRARFRGTAMTRARRAGLARNAAVAMGNRGNPGDLPALAAAAAHDADPMVREHAAWALARYGEHPAAPAARAPAASP